MSKVTVLLPADTSLKKECDTIRSEIDILKKDILSKNKKYSTDIEVIPVSISDAASISKNLCSDNPMVVYGDDLANKIEEMTVSGNVINGLELVGSETSAGCKPCLMVAAGDLKNLAKNPFFKNRFFYRFCYSGDRYAKWLSLTKVVENLKTDRIGFLAITGDAFAVSMFEDLKRYLRRQKKELYLKEITSDAPIDVQTLSGEFKALYISGFGDNLKSLFDKIRGYKGAVFTDSAFAVIFNEYGFSFLPDYEVFVLMPTAIEQQHFKDYFAYFVYAAVLYLLENEWEGASGANQITRMISTERRLGDVLIQDGGDLIFEQSLFHWEPRQKKFIPEEDVGLGNTSAETLLKAHGLAAQMQGIDNIIDGINVKISGRELSGLKNIAKKIARQIEVSFGSNCLSLYLNNENINAEEKLLYVTEKPIWGRFSANPDKIREFLGRLKGLKLKDPIQISMLKDSEDNNTYQFYIVQETKEKKSVCQIYPLSEYSSLFCVGQISAIIIAKTEEMARIIHSKYFDNISEESIGWVRYYGGWICSCDNSHAQSVIYGFKLLYRYFNNSSDSGDNARRYCYLIPDIALTDNQNDGNSFAVIATRDKLNYLKLRLLVNCVTRFFSVVNGSIHSQLLKIANIKSAIGSIMSRNGSHNIGSHVLAALSHNVGTMPDDRVLYQYIQHRMDYIATATTDFPVWKQPLYLVGNLMKTFLMQRHLLDHITGSEGLRAYQFQNDRIDTTKDGCQPNTIRIHIRRINDADSEWGEANNFSAKQNAINFISYPDSPCNAEAMKHDLELAIPGGIIGQHAFFTILENILRNAAKHEWAKLKNDKKGYLDVHIDFKDNPNSGIVEFVVWTDSEYSRQNYKVGTFKNRAVRLTREDVLARLSQDDSSGELDTNGLEEHQKLQLMMARSLINNEGQLRKENWGLAEMRISAGFLNVVDIATIGGLGDRTATMDLISPTMVLYKDHYCMGYHFHVPKPRELLIVVPDDLLKNKKNAIQKTDLESAHAKLMKYGVGIVTEDEVGKESGKPERSDRLSYAYALFNKFNRDCMRTWKIPFRLVTIANDPLSPPLSPKKDKGQKPIDRRADFTGNADFFAPNSFSAWLRDALESDDKAKEHAEKILSEIYASWVRHLKKECFGVGNGLKNIPIAIDLDGDNKNAEGSLISDMELLELVLGDCFNSAVDSYLTSPLSEKADDSLKHTLKLLKTLHPRIIELQRLKTKTLIDTEKNKEIKVARDVDGVIRAQLLTWCIALEEDANVRKIASDLYYIEEGCNQTCTPGLKGFMLFLTNTILNQVKALMTRYEERFVPLPRDILPPKHQTSQRSENRDPNSQHGGNGCLEPLIDLGNQQIFETVSDEVKCNFLEEHMNASNDTAEILAFWRHEVSASPRTIERGKKEIKLRYREPLSGSQSYLNSFETFYDGSSREIQRKRFVAKLLETGLTKVLLIDERVKRFENEHSNVKATFADIGISTLDNECCETKELFNFAQQKRHPIDVKIDDQLISEFDIVVIHQGVIDKLLADHNNPDKIREFIEYLKSEIRYVVVTTGRGNPANIPNDVRVLPFSVIESTLFKKYPEKLIFIDAIMNLLPSGGKE